MSEVNPAPNRTYGAIQSSTGSAPAMGPGLAEKALDPTNQTFYRGRVEDVMADRYGCVCSIYGRKGALPCIIASAAVARWNGAKEFSMLSVGEEVVIACPMDGKYGIILGSLNPPTDGKPKPTHTLSDSGVFTGDEKSAHTSKDFGFQSFLPASGAGVPADQFPGEWSNTNDLGAGHALLQFLSLIRGSDGSKIEAFVFDQLLRVTGYNLEERTCLTDRSILDDFGFFSEEESGTPFMNEALGLNDDPETPLADLYSSRRFQNFRGFIGGLIQKFIIRPSKGPNKMDEIDDKPDLGLSQKTEHISGMFLDRTITGGGIVKSVCIPVPKKKKNAYDPGGDYEEPENKTVLPFSFDDAAQSPASRICQIRDWLAYHFNVVMPSKLGERANDWSVPDESDAPSLSQGDEAPGIGDFFREFPPDVDVMNSSAEGTEHIQDEKNSTNARMGTAYSIVFPDGSVAMRCIWGSEIIMSGGHIDISASKDVRIRSGGSTIVLSGDDFVAKAKKSVDVSSSDGQVRIKSQHDMFIHAETGGMMLSLNGTGYNYSNDPGEQRHLPGITFKVPNRGGVTFNAGQVTMNLSNALFLNQDGDGNYPSIIGKINGCYLQFQSGLMSMLFSGGGGLGISNGSIFTTGDYIGEGGVFVKGSGIFGSEPSYPGDWSEVPPIISFIAPTFANIDQYQWQYDLSDLKDATFSFRTTEDYATRSGAWFESAWQRELVGVLDQWIEPPDSAGEYPYPGREHYEKGSFWKYAEQNVTPNGRSKKREEVTGSPKGFSAVTWNEFPIHPPR